MRKKEIYKVLNQTLVVWLLAAFVVSAVFPDFKSEANTFNIEETDMDGSESSEEEKKESKEDKENPFQGMNAIGLAFEREQILKHPELTANLLERYLPVITPPPDSMA